MIQLFEKDTHATIGTISESQLQFLRDQLEEEGVEDQDYAITAMLLDSWEGDNVQPELTKILREALRGRDEVNIAWSEGV